MDMRFVKNRLVILATIFMLAIGGGCQKESEEVRVEWKEKSRFNQQEFEAWQREREAEGKSIEYKEEKKQEGSEVTGGQTDGTAPSGEASDHKPDREDPFWGCNYDPKASKVKMVAANLKSTPSRVGGRDKGTRWQVEVQSTINIDGNTDQTTATADFAIMDASSPRVRKKAEKKANTYSNTTTFANIPFSKLVSSLNRDDNPCGFMMADTIKMNSRDQTTYANLSFDKPFLYMLSPLLSLKRFEKELKKRIVIKDIRATIETNDREIQKTGISERVGEVEIFRIQETRTVIDSKGASVTLSGDYAYRVSSKFNGRQAAKSIAWLDQVSDYYIKDNKIVGIVTQLPREEINIVVYKSN